MMTIYQLTPTDNYRTIIQSPSKRPLSANKARCPYSVWCHVRAIQGSVFMKLHAKTTGSMVWVCEMYIAAGR